MSEGIYSREKVREKKKKLSHRWHDQSGPEPTAVPNKRCKAKQGLREKTSGFRSLGLRAQGLGIKGSLV